jgi:WD40 repeat protein
MGLQPLIQWDATTGMVLRRQMGPDRIYSVAYSPDGKWVAAGCPRGARIWSADTGDERQVLRQPAPHVADVAFSPDSRTLATAGGNTVGLWHVETGASRQTLTGPSDQLDAVAISPDGAIVAAGGQDRAVWLWDARTGKTLGSLEGHTAPVTELAFAPDGRLISSSADGSVRFWSPVEKRLLVTLTVLPPSDEGDISTRWMATTPEGYFTGDDVNRFVRWRVDGKLYPAQRYGKFRKESPIVKALLPVYNTAKMP